MNSEPVISADHEHPLLAAVRSHVLRIWNDRHDPRLVYHNFSQAGGVARLAGDIARAEGLSEAECLTAQLAAWFFNAGYLYEAREAPETSAIRAEFFLAEQKCPSEQIQRVRQTITDVLGDGRPQTAEARVLSDAVLAYDWVETVEHRRPLLRYELELINDHPMSDPEWYDRCGDLIGQGRFFTAFAKINYETRLAERRLQWQTAVPARPGKPVKTTPVQFFDRLARRPLRSSIQTFFRVSYANHIRLSAISDNKAHIMISVNSILMSVAISMLTYQSLTTRNPFFILPIVIFLMTSLTSLIFAVLSSRPRVTSFVPLPDHPVNPVFFGNFVQLTLEQYEQAVDGMLRDGRLLFGNMARDIYYLGQVLDRKYRLLTFSYTVFMMGFVATVGAFLGAYFLG